MSGAGAIGNRQSAARPDRLRFARPEGVSIHSPLPRRGVDFDATVTLSEKAVYEFLRQHVNTRTLKDGSYQNDDAPGYAEIAKAVRLSRRTIARRVRSMITKGYVLAYERIGHGRRVGTRYVLPFWGKMREQWAQDSTIATLPNGDPIVYGRGKKFMTREAAHSWRIPGIKPAPETRQPTATIPIPASRPIEEMTAGTQNRPPPLPDLSSLKPIFTEYCGSYDASDLEDLWNAVFEGEPSPTVGDVVEVSTRAARHLKYDVKLRFITPKRLIDATVRRMNAWRDKEVDRRKTAESRAQSDRDRAANEIATYMIDLDNPAITPEARSLAWEKVGSAPPEIQSAARRLYESIKSRKTGAAGA